MSSHESTQSAPITIRLDGYRILAKQASLILLCTSALTMAATDLTVEQVIAGLERRDQAIKNMFGGIPINSTEKRAVLHTALRNKSKNPVFYNSENVMPQIQNELEKMRLFCHTVRATPFGETQKARGCRKLKVSKRRRRMVARRS